jgi:hypothetical protein
MAAMTLLWQWSPTTAVRHSVVLVDVVVLVFVYVVVIVVELLVFVVVEEVVVKVVVMVVVLMVNVVLVEVVDDPNQGTLICMTPCLSLPTMVLANPATPPLLFALGVGFSSFRPLVKR